MTLSVCHRQIQSIADSFCNIRSLTPSVQYDFNGHFAMAVYWIVYRCYCRLQKFSVLCATHIFTDDVTLFSSTVLSSFWVSVLTRPTGVSVGSQMLEWCGPWHLLQRDCARQFLRRWFFLIQMKQRPLFFKISLRFWALVTMVHWTDEWCWPH